MPVYKINEVVIDFREDPYEAAERAAVAFYGTDRKAGWITAASLQEGPHESWEWSGPKRTTQAEKP